MVISEFCLDYRRLGSPDESDDGVLEWNVFSNGVSENVDVGRRGGASESQLKTKTNSVFFCPFHFYFILFLNLSLSLFQ